MLDTPIIESVIGCHGKYAFSHSTNMFNFWDDFVSHLGDPSERFGTHENLSEGA